VPLDLFGLWLTSFVKTAAKLARHTGPDVTIQWHLVFMNIHIPLVSLPHLVAVNEAVARLLRETLQRPVENHTLMCEGTLVLLPDCPVLLRFPFPDPGEKEPSVGLELGLVFESVTLDDPPFPPTPKFIEPFG